jgi:hypothetical protein
MKKNIRTFTMPNLPVKPEWMLAGMKKAGFVFDSDTCPIKITKPWTRVENVDDTVTWIQWEEWA